MRPRKTAMASNLNMLYRQLAAMSASGMTISDSITALAEEAEGSPLRDIVTQMHTELEQGKSVGEVAMQHLHLLRGLSASVLDRALPAVSQFFSEMAEFNEKRQTLRRFLILSFIYPAFVATLAFAVLAMLLIVSVPMFASMYEDTAGVLPLPTRVGLKPPFGPGIRSTRPIALSACIWFRTVAGFLRMTSAISSPLIGWEYCMIEGDERNQDILLDEG